MGRDCDLVDVLVAAPRSCLGLWIPWAHRAIAQCSFLLPLEQSPWGITCGALQGEERQSPAFGWKCLQCLLLCSTTGGQPLRRLSLADSSDFVPVFPGCNILPLPRKCLKQWGAFLPTSVLVSCTHFFRASPKSFPARLQETPKQSEFI